MRTENINIYQFDELSDEAKNKARDWWRNGYEFDVSYVLDNFEDEMKTLGVEISDIAHNDGGAEFKYTIDLPKWLEANVSEADYRLVRRLLKNDKIGTTLYGSFDPSYGAPFPSLEVYQYSYISNRMDVKLIAFEARVAHWIRGKANDLYLRVRDELDYMYSDNYIDECIMAGEYEFTISGARWCKY